MGKKNKRDKTVITREEVDKQYYESVVKNLEGLNFVERELNIAANSELINRVRRNLDDFEEKISYSANGLYANIKNSADEFNAGYKERKQLLESKFKTSDSLLFVRGDAAEARNEQIAALSFADLCFKAENIARTSLSLLEQARTAFDNFELQAFGVKVVICDGEKGKLGNANILSGFDSALQAKLLEQLKNDGCTEKLLRKVALSVINSLSKCGIRAYPLYENADIYIKQDYEKGKSLIRECTNAITGVCKQSYIPERAYPFYIIGEFVNAWEEWNIVVKVLTAPLYLGILPYPFMPLLDLLLDPFIVPIKNHKVNKAQQAHNELVKYSEDLSVKAQEDYDKLFDWYKIYNAIDKEVISVDYARFEKLRERIAELSLKADGFYKETQERSKLINYLPSGFDRDLLPSVIEKLSSGEALEFNTAVRMAKQDYQAEEANAAQLRAIREGNARAESLQREQMRSQEEYERKRMTELQESLKRQEEERRRATEYARQQAEAARTAAQAQEKAAAYAEKQADAANEMLRRSEDPYYINKWNGSN